jgi:hypothetical protein
LGFGEGSVTGHLQEKESQPKVLTPFACSAMNEVKQGAYLD